MLYYYTILMLSQVSYPQGHILPGIVMSPHHLIVTMASTQKVVVLSPRPITTTHSPFSPPPPHSGGRLPLPGEYMVLPTATHSPPPPPPPTVYSVLLQARHYGRYRSASLSPPPRPGHGGRHERSPPPEPMHASPQPRDDRYDSRKHHMKRKGSPSPKDKYKEYGTCSRKGQGTCSTYLQCACRGQGIHACRCLNLVTSVGKS